jgi:hypothetical protein
MTSKGGKVFSPRPMTLGRVGATSARTGHVASSAPRPVRCRLAGGGEMVTTVEPRRAVASRPDVDERFVAPAVSPNPSVPNGLATAGTQVKVDTRQAACSLHNAVASSDRTSYQGPQQRRSHAPVVPSYNGAGVEQDVGGIELLYGSEWVRLRQCSAFSSFWAWLGC